jgi:hypothetical protein
MLIDRYLPQFDVTGVHELRHSLSPSSGSEGRLCQRDYGWRPVPEEAFAGFNEPGYAQLA